MVRSSSGAKAGPGSGGAGYRYFPVSPLLLFPDVRTDFRVYLKQDTNYVLYTKEHTNFTDEHRESLHKRGVTKVYVNADQKYMYDKYVEENLAMIMGRDEIDQSERAELLHDTMSFVVRFLFENRLPDRFNDATFKRLVGVVSAAVKFASSKEGALKLAERLTREKGIVSHSMQVFLLSLFLFQSFKLSEPMLLKCGMGALLHDIGKAKLPRNIVEKIKPHSAEEEQLYKMHPFYGAGMLSMVPAPPEVFKCVLFHHERQQGGGYPYGIHTTALPAPVRVVRICDAYDTMISLRGHSPKEALKIMNEERDGHYDMSIFKRLVVMLKSYKLA